MRTVWQSSCTMTYLTSVGSRKSRFLFRLIVFRSEQLPHLVFCPLTMALEYGSRSFLLSSSSLGTRYWRALSLNHIRRTVDSRAVFSNSPEMRSSSAYSRREHPGTSLSRW